MKDFPGKVPIIFVLIVSIIGGSIISLLLTGFYEENYDNIFISIILNIFVFSQVYVGLRFGFFFTKFNPNYNKIYSLNINYRFIFYLTAIIFIFTLNFIKFHVLGVVAESQNPPFLEGMIEILMRFIFPVLSLFFFNNWKNLKLIDKSILIIITLLSIYIDLFVKSSKQVIFTYVFIGLFYYVYGKKRINYLIALLTILVGISAYLYILFTRVQTYDDLKGFNFLSADGPLHFILESLNIRMVNIYETMIYLSSDISLININYPYFGNYSVANLYSNEVHGILFDSGTSSAPGLVNFFMFSFGYIGLILPFFLGLYFHFLYYIAYMLTGKNFFGILILDILLISSLLDATLDERIFSLFIFKLLLFIGFLGLIGKVNLKK